MTFMDICSKRTYIDKNKAEKTTWLKCGTMRITEEGKTFIELNHLPNTVFYVFKQKERTEAA